jgi:hypothetical protein
MTSPMLTHEAIRKAADHIWPLEDLSTDEARDELVLDTKNGLSAFLAAQDRDALAMEVEVAYEQASGQIPRTCTCGPPGDPFVCDDCRALRARAVIDVLLDGPDE